MAAREVKSILLAEIDCAPQVRGRFDEGSVAGLARSFAEVGILQPILVRPAGDRWVVVAGHRRLQAAKLAGWTEIPALVEEAELAEADVLQRQLIENAQRQNLSPLERAMAIRRLMQAQGWTAARTAASLGLSPATVSKLLTLLALPEDVREQVHSGQIPASTAYEVAKVVEPGERAALAVQAKEGRLTRDQASARSRGRRHGGRPRTRSSPRARLPRVVFPLERHGSVAITGSELALPEVVAKLEQLVERLRPLADAGVALDEARRQLLDESRGDREHGRSTEETSDA